MEGWDVAGRVRRRIGAAIIERVSGPPDPARRRLAGEGWFAADRPVRQVHADASMFVGGIRALLLQSLHPLAMAAVAGHSGYRGDPWGRLQRTSYFLAVTTFGQAGDAQQAIARVRAVHQQITGIAPDGRPYAASDPRLLTWVHITETDSFLRTHARFGALPLDQAGRDGYVADMARIGAALGVPDPPRTEAELTARINAYRPELAATAQARNAAQFLLLHPPLPMIARVPYTVLAAAAVSLLPNWARQQLSLPRLPVCETMLVRPAGHAMVHAIRWAITAPSAPSQRPRPRHLPTHQTTRHARQGNARSRRAQVADAGRQQCPEHPGSAWRRASISSTKLPNRST
ncbi:MAG TPA: oxygenase MpaB family protein [Streptosporangiaceae bacterium]